MSDMHDLVEPFSRLLADCCPPKRVRVIEAGGDWRTAWALLAQSGFLDALVPESAGGFGLTLADIGPLVALVGASAAPLPIAETMVARALLGQAGRAVPEDPIVLATGTLPTPLAALAPYHLSGTLEDPILSKRVESMAPIEGRLDCVLPAAGGGLRPIAAIVRAMLIAGAADRVLEMSVQYANDRHQFGKPIGRQQAVQQQLAVLAEHAVSARICAAIGARATLSPTLHDAAVAKIGASMAAGHVAAIAHAVHGAIGISEEFDLQLLTRRLHCWRLADGSQRYWADQLAQAAFARPSPSALSFALEMGS
jgi:acyl-CoA dehydrogenase